MSHEIHTPLNGVLGLSALLADSNMPEDARSMLRLVRSSGETLAKILDDVLDFSRIESGKLELEQAPFSFRDAMEWGVELFRAMAGNKHLRLNLSVESGVPERLDGDATRIRQVLANLIGNAIKFTEQGTIDVEAGLAREPAPAGQYRIRVSVRDSGIGIPPDKLSRLFQPFSQVDASSNRRFGGSGLGLAISRRLVAEDNPVNQTVVKLVLQRLGCNVDVVADGMATLSRVQAASYDAILMDIQMPGLGGLEAARRIRSLSAPCSRTPIVGLTASVTVENREACFAAGMNDYLSKPLSIDALRKALGRYSPANRLKDEAPEPSHNAG
jgi:CheY-like chemotaxis protein